MPPRRARFTSGQPPPLLPLMSSAGRHYRAARASAAAASSQKPARAPVVRGHTPSRRAPPPPAFRSARAPPRAAECRRLGERGVQRSGAAALRRCNRAERRRRCARCRADHWCPGPQGWRPGAVALCRSGRKSRDFGEAAASAPSRPPCPLPTYRTAGCSARFAATGRPAHLPRGWRVGAAGPRGGAAGAGRLHLLSE